MGGVRTATYPKRGTMAARSYTYASHLVSSGLSLEIVGRLSSGPSAMLSAPIGDGGTKGGEGTDGFADSSLEESGFEPSVPPCERVGLSGRNANASQATRRVSNASSM